MSEKEQRAAGADPVGEVGTRFFRALGETYPVCAASDEFYFFPQVTSADRDWSVWDDFSPEGTGLFADPEAGLSALRGTETRLDPGTSNHSLYDDVFVRYRKIWKAIVT